MRKCVDEVLDATDQPGRVIEERWLRTNLLSSQPLAFNLFAPLASDLALATRALRLVFQELVRRVDEVSFEWRPGRGDEELLGNHSAF